jgi:hypothetical protein
MTLWADRIGRACWSGRPRSDDRSTTLMTGALLGRLRERIDVERTSKRKPS